MKFMKIMVLVGWGTFRTRFASKIDVGFVLRITF